MPIKYQSQLCASSELTQISDKLHTITAVESTIVVTITKLQITNINGNLHVPVHYLFNVSTVRQVLLEELSTTSNCATYEITIKLHTAFHQKRKLKI